MTIARPPKNKPIPPLVPPAPFMGDTITRDGSLIGEWGSTRHECNATSRLQPSAFSLQLMAEPRQDSSQLVRSVKVVVEKCSRNSCRARVGFDTHDLCIAGQLTRPDRRAAKVDAHFKRRVDVERNAGAEQNTRAA